VDYYFFYAFAALTVVGAIATITLRNVVHSAIALIGALLGIAGLYLLQHAEFLFVVQIILYIGGIMVLFLFVIMLVNLDEAAKVRQFTRHWWVAVLGVLAVFGQGLLMTHKSGYVLPWGNPAQASAESAGNTEALADVLFSTYLLPFEIASILLLVAVVGSVYMAKKS
jgi:NADH-quinone oxidoreductase subunit J